MSQYPASGVLFTNDRKQNERQPDYTGNIELDKDTVLDLYKQLEESGVEYPKINLVGWRKTSKNGKAFLSLRGSILRERQEGQTAYQAQAPAQAPAPSASFDDEIPF